MKKIKYLKYVMLICVVLRRFNAYKMNIKLSDH